MPHGPLVTRPHSSPLMKFPSRPAASPSGHSGATKSVTSSQRLPRRRANSHNAISTPRKPPWKLMPPGQQVLPRAQLAEHDEQHEADEVHEPVPANRQRDRERAQRERADGERDRVELRMDEHAEAMRAALELADYTH